MTHLLLDTSAYSALVRGYAAIAELVQEADRVCLNPVVLAELQAGFLKGSKTRENERNLRRFLGLPDVAVVAIDADTAERHALIMDGLRRLGTPRATHDVWIAASAAQHGLRIVTCDRDFAGIDQVRVELFHPRE